MVKLLRLLLLFAFGGGASTLFLVQCACVENLPTDDGNDDVSDQERDLQNFNKMVEKFEKTLKIKIESVLLSEYEVRDGKYSQLQGVLEQGANLQEPKALVALSDVGVLFLQQQFQGAFDETNREIAREYSNLYVNSFPGVFLNQETKVSVNLVQIGKLQELAGGDVSSTLKMTRLDLQFAYELRYKSLASQKKTYQTEVLLTNDLDLKTEFEIKLTKKVNDLLYPELLNFKEINDEMFKEKMESIYKETLIDGFHISSLFVKFSEKIIIPLIEKTIKKAFKISSEINVNVDMLYDNLFIPKTSLDLNITDIFQEIYGKSSEIRKKSVDEIRMHLFNGIESKFNWLKNHNYENVTNLKLSAIKILGFRLPYKFEFLKNPQDENNKLRIKFSISNEIIKPHLDNMIDFIVHFCDFYQVQVDSNNQKAIFFLDQNFYDKFITSSQQLFEYFAKKSLFYENLAKNNYLQIFPYELLRFKYRSIMWSIKLNFSFEVKK